ncbi:MAG TPA: energy transducer TonB [Terracidiphilus sp.]|jgi:TonB family protein|nr:energy transducer TonB [Terracidiphilus sp.]
MEMNYTPGRTNFGLLPEPERSTASFVTSSVINGIILALVLYIGATAKHVLEQHHYEMTELIAPTTPPPQPKIKQPPPPKLPPPEPPKVKLEAPKIEMPKPKPPEPKPIQMEAKLTAPVMKPAKPAIVLAPQPKAALTAAMPAQTPQVKPSTAPVHLGETFGATPNPNATRPATVAAIGNPYGGMQGPAVAPHGVVGSTGIGDGVKAGSNAGTVGKVASAGIPGATGDSAGKAYGKVASAGIPTAVAAAPMAQRAAAAPTTTNLEVISKPPVQYTSEARQLKVEGDVVLRVTFLADGQVVVHDVVKGLGHGLDEEARKVAQHIHFRPATRDGHPIDLTTTITISFQLA